jgi:hypothetical protein
MRKLASWMEQLNNVERREKNYDILKELDGNELKLLRVL